MTIYFCSGCKVLSKDNDTIHSLNFKNLNINKLTEIIIIKNCDTKNLIFLYHIIKNKYSNLCLVNKLYNKLYITIRKLIKQKQQEQQKLDHSRPSWNEIFIKMCEVLVLRSTCLRIQTSSIIQKDNVIVSIGYNGTPSGSEHCNEYWKKYYLKNMTTKYFTFNNFLKSKDFYKLHHEWSNLNELHGELNAILQAGKNGISLKNSKLYTLYSPCINCAKSIIMSGIYVVYYKYEYKRDLRGINLLKKNNILTKIL